MMSPKKPANPAVKPTVSQADSDLFRKAVAAMKPLKPVKHAKSLPIKKQPFTPTFISMEYIDHFLGPDDPLHYAKNGMQHKTLQRLKRGQIGIEAYLDLHRHTLEQATSLVTDFIENCVTQHKRCVCIVHGKGHASADKPVLKNFLNQWLREHPHVLAFQSAIPKHGGTGAVYVLLRRQ